MKRKNSSWRMVLLWVLTIAAFGFFFRPNPATSAQADAEQLTVTGASGYCLTIPYDAIKNVELREDFAFGRMIDGTDTKQEKSGIWENEELGKYLLCADAKINACIVLRMETDIYVLNFESLESTQRLFEALQVRIK